MVGGSLIAGNMVSVCSFHQAFFLANGHIQTVQRVLNHSLKWQRFFNEALPAECPVAGQNVTDAAGNVVGVVLRRDAVDWVWNGDTLEVTLHFQPTAQQLNRINNRIAQLGGAITVTIA